MWATTAIKFRPELPVRWQTVIPFHITAVQKTQSAPKSCKTFLQTVVFWLLQITIFKENVVQFSGLPVYVSENPSFKQLLGISTIWPDAWGDYYSTWVNVMINNCLHLSKIDNALLNSSRCPAALDISLANAPNSWCQFILKCCYCSVMILTWWYNSSDTCTCGVFITVLICPSIYCQLLNVYLSPLSYDLQYFSAMYIVSACIASSGGKRLVLLSGHSVTVVLTVTAVIGHKLFWVGET